MTEFPRMGKILPFEQNASFYARRGDVRRMEGKLLLALRMYRRAIQLEDANVAYRMEAAAICSEMGCFQQSNALLAGALWRNGGDVPQEYFYNYGCNFAGLHDYAKAMECFSLFIEEDSFSEHAAEIYDLLEAVEEEGLSGAFGDELDEETAGLCAGGVSLLSRGKVGEGVDKLEQAWSRAPDSAYVASNLAVAYSCAKEYGKGVEVCCQALEKDALNPYVNCALGMLYSSMGNREKVAEQVERIKLCPLDDWDAANKAAMALAEMGAWEDAQKLFHRLVDGNVFDVDLLHRAAVNCYKLGLYEEAERHWSRAARIEPDSAVISWHLKEARRAKQSGKPRQGLSFGMMLPLDEIIARAHKILIWQTQEREEFLEQPGFDEILNWGLQESGPVHVAALGILCKVDPQRAEKQLRDELCAWTEDDGAKRDLCAMLHMIGAEEPYIAAMENGIAEVTLDVMRGLEHLPKEYRPVADLLLQSMRERECEEEIIQLGVALWIKYVQKLQENGDPEVNPGHLAAYAAALEYSARNVLGKTLSQKKLCGIYGVSAYQFRKENDRLYFALFGEE